MTALQRAVFSRIGVNLKNRSLSVLIKSAGILIRVLILIHSRARRRRAETLAVALASVDRFEFRLLSGRHEMRVFFQILDDLFRDNLALETAQRALD